MSERTDDQVGKVDTERQRIGGPTRGGTSSRIASVFFFIFGLLFFGFGGLFVLISLELVPIETEGGESPSWVVTAVGALFALVGLAAMAAGGWGIARAVRHRRLIARYPGEPWMADYPWPRERYRSRSGVRVLGLFVFGGFLVLFLIPFNWWLWTDRHWLLMLIVGVFDAIALGLFGYAAYRLGRWLKFGETYVRYEKFPFHPGDPVTLYWGGGRGLGAYDRIDFTLRHVEQRIEGSGDHRSTVRYQTWATSYSVDEPGAHAGVDELPISFLLPGNVPTTRLRGAKARYWELEIHARSPGVDFHETYLVPVYPRPKRSAR